MSLSGGQKEAFSRVVIDAQLNDVGWNLTDGQSVRYEYQLPDGELSDRVRHVRAIQLQQSIALHVTTETLKSVIFHASSRTL